VLTYSIYINFLSPFCLRLSTWNIVRIFYAQRTQDRQIRHVLLKIYRIRGDQFTFNMIYMTINKNICHKKAKILWLSYTKDHVPSSLLSCAPGLGRALKHKDKDKANSLQFSILGVECTVLRRGRQGDLGSCLHWTSQAALLSSIVKVSMGALLRALMSFRRPIGVKM